MICDDILAMVCSYGPWEEDHLDTLDEKILKKASYIAFSRAFSFEESKFILQETPSLLRAVRRGYYNVVSHILSTQKFDRDLYIEAINQAIEYSYLSIIKLILYNFPSDGNITGVINSCFCSACSIGNVDVVGYFLSIDAYPHTHCDTPILVASRAGKYAVVQLLLENATFSGVTLTYAAIQAHSGDHLRVVKLLRTYGANDQDDSDSDLF